MVPRRGPVDQLIPSAAGAVGAAEPGLAAAENRFAPDTAVDHTQKSGRPIGMCCHSRPPGTGRAQEVLSGCSIAPSVPQWTWGGRCAAVGKAVAGSAGDW